MEHGDKKYGDSVCLFVLIDTNELGLAEVILAGLGRWNRSAIFDELIANRLKGFLYNVMIISYLPEKNNQGISGENIVKKKKRRAEFIEIE